MKRLPRLVARQKPLRILALLLAVVLVGRGPETMEFLGRIDHSNTKTNTNVTLSAAQASQLSVPQLAWFYNPTMDSRVLATSTLYILNHGQESQRNRMRSAGAHGTMLQYVAAYGINDSGYGNTVSWDHRGEASAIVAKHPDWVLRDAKNRPIRARDTSDYLMDPANPGWRAFWLRQVSHANAGWDGVFLDNVDLSEQRFSAPSPKYPTAESFAAAMTGFLTKVSASLHAMGKILYANLTEDTGDAKIRAEYLKRLDGFMQEAFAVNWTSGYVSRSQWLADLANVDAGPQRDAILVSQGSPNDTTRQQFAYASYLLVARPGVYFRYGSAAEGYHTFWNFADFSIKLGAPVGKRFAAAHGTWRRNFEHGYVIVDPNRHTSVIA